MKKRLFFGFSICLMASIMVFTSCKGGVSNPFSLKMDDAKTMEKIEDYYKKLNLDDFKVTAVQWIEKDKMSNEPSVVVFSLLRKDGGNYTQSFIMQGPGEGVAGDLSASKSSSKLDYETVNAISPAEFKADVILGYYEAAKAQIPEGYTYQGISSHRIDTNSRNNQRTNSFKLMVTEDGNEEVKSAGRTMIEYYEIDFDVLEDGSVQMQD